MKDFLSFFTIEEHCSLDSFLERESAYELMEISFDKALSNEIDKFNFSAEMQSKVGKGKFITDEEKVSLVNDFIKKVEAKELIVFFWDREVFALALNQEKYNIIEQIVRKIDGDIVLVSKDTLNGISFLNEEHFIRFSEWLKREN